MSIEKCSAPLALVYDTRILLAELFSVLTEKSVRLRKKIELISNFSLKLVNYVSLVICYCQLRVIHLLISQSVTCI